MSDRGRLVVHTIRLRGPWEFSIEDAAWQGPRDGIVRLPEGARGPLCDEYRSTLVLRRRFGMPTGIARDDRLELVIESDRPITEGRLNGHLLHEGSVRSLRIDVTDSLAARNELHIVLNGGPEEVSLGQSAGARAADWRLLDARLEISRLV